MTAWTVTCQAPLSMRFPRKNIGVGCHALLQGIFPTQESNPVLPHCRQILHCLSHQPSSGVPISTSQFRTLSRAVFKFPKIPALLMAMRPLPQNTRGSPRSGYLALPSGSDGRELEEAPSTTPGCLCERDVGHLNSELWLLTNYMTTYFLSYKAGLQ